tara:strand:- start:1542 stop:2057 length:516 start_codon:yes stop_codon:yes gene_type:complete
MNKATITNLLEQLANVSRQDYQKNPVYDPSIIQYITNHPNYVPNIMGRTYNLDKRIQKANIPENLPLSSLDAPLLQNRNWGKFPVLKSGKYPSKEKGDAMYQAIDDEINIFDILQQRDILHYLINAMNESQNIFEIGRTRKGAMAEDANIMDEFLEETSIMSQMINAAMNP